jgi:putative ABC transport system permease protein
LKIPLVSGRFFNSHDIASAPAVAVVTQRSATIFWGAEDPLGKVIRVVGSGREFTIVGVAADVLNTSLDQTFIPAIYFSAPQRGWPTMDIVLRTTGKPEIAIAEARQALRNLDPALPLSNVKTMEQWIGNSVAQPRLNAALVGLFAISALLIGAVGIYGVLSFSVSQRTREIGVRMALGAKQTNVVRMILAEGLSVACIGIALGIATSAALTRVLSSLLFDVGTHEPAVYVVAPVILALVAALACILPARRASQVDPAITLRD